MTLEKMSADDERIVAECLRAVAQGPFFDEYDLRVLFWATRGDILEAAETGDLDNNLARRLVALTFLHLLGRFHEREEEWGEWISVSRTTVEEIAGRWRARQSPVQFEVYKVYGPAKIDGRFYRVVEYRVTTGGHGLSGEVWSEGRWVGYDSGPGCRVISAAQPATEEEMRRVGVDWSPPGIGYDPFRVESE